MTSSKVVSEKPGKAPGRADNPSPPRRKSGCGAGMRDKGESSASQSRQGMFLLLLCSLWLAPLLTSCDSGRSADDLISYVKVGDSEGLKAALEGGADPNARDAAGRSPLDAAVVFNRASMAAILLDHGASPSAASLELARSLRRKDVERTILEHMAGGVPAGPAQSPKR